MTTCYDVFAECVKAVRDGELIQSISAKDKEFHFQNWFQGRLKTLALEFDEPGRNTYPDFRLVHHPEGYEVKGLAWPGREKDYDCNSQIPSGKHHGRTIFYVFGRYPVVQAGEKEYPVIDLVICHGDFLNADHNYVHKNKSIKGFGSYGDILIRDRKMYVAPTPFALCSGSTGALTLILPEDFLTDDRFEQVGKLTRTETSELVVGYRFDLRENILVADKVSNPAANRQHRFMAYRLKGQGGKPVSILTAASEITSETNEG
ncbi:MAG TPA: hypothetical protein VNO70_03390 [Blastocatellia bacterium]|nr:hypothetical protein [Blastocatellia bacterium]